MASSSARALLPLLATALLPACSEAPPPREVTPWAQSFPLQGNASVNALAVDAYSGSVALAGTFSGTMDFGTGPLESYFGSDIFVTQVGDTGKTTWGGHTGGSNYLGQQGVAVAPSGNVVATGMFTESIGFGGASFTTKSQSSYLVCFDAAGSLLWQLKLGTDSNTVTSSAVTIDAEGNIVIAGSFTGEADFGGAHFVTQGQSTFVAKYDADGNPIFGHAFAGSGHSALAVAVDSVGDTVIYGRNYGDFHIGNTSFVSTGSDAFVAKLDRQGGEAWGIPLLNDQGYLTPAGLAVSPTGEVVIAGAFYGVVNLGSLTLPLSVQGSYGFAAKLSSAGKPLWLESFGGNDINGNGSAVTSVALGSAGEIYLSGAYSGEADFGTGPLPSAINSALFLAELDAGGKAQVVRTFEEPGTIYSIGQALAVDPQGGLVLAGTLNGSLVFGGTTIRSPMSGASLFLARVKTPL